MTGRWHLGGGGGVAHAQVEVDWPYTQHTRAKYVALLLYRQRLLSRTVHADPEGFAFGCYMHQLGFIPNKSIGLAITLRMKLVLVFGFGY